MASEWVKVFESSNPIEAEITLAMLAGHGISAVEMNKRDSSYQTFGMIELYCPQKDVLTALHLIREHK